MNAAGFLLLGLLSVYQGSDARTHLVVVVGIGGAPAYAEEFHDLAGRLATNAGRRHGIISSDIHILAESPEEVTGFEVMRSTKENVEATLDDLALEAGPDDRLLLVLIGHGSFGNGESRFNLPGPDLTPSPHRGVRS